MQYHSSAPQTGMAMQTRGNRYIFLLLKKLCTLIRKKKVFSKHINYLVCHMRYLFRLQAVISAQNRLEFPGWERVEQPGLARSVPFHPCGERGLGRAPLGSVCGRRSNPSLPLWGHPQCCACPRPPGEDPVLSPCPRLSCRQDGRWQTGDLE